MAETITCILNFLVDIGTWVMQNLWIFPVGIITLITLRLLGVIRPR